MARAAASHRLLEGTVGFLFAVIMRHSDRHSAVLLAVLPMPRCSRCLSAAQTMPLISIAPLFLIWFGFEISGKIVIVAVFGLFPIAVQTDSRTRGSAPVLFRCGVDMRRDPGTWTLWHVKLRVAARQIYGGIRVSAAYIFATAATAEYLGARKGLGIWLQAAYNSFRTPLIFSATIGHHPDDMAY